MAVNPPAGWRSSVVRQNEDTIFAAAEAVTAPSEKLISGTSRVGTELRAARERLGWALPDVAKSLRIRLPYLAAIEAGRVEDLPAGAYAMGFLRSYANLLGLPAENLCRAYRDEIGQAQLAPELVFPSPLRERGVPFGAAALIAVVIAIGGYAGWYKLTENRPGQVASVPPVPERLAPLAEPVQQAALPAPVATPPAVVAQNQLAPAFPASAPQAVATNTQSAGDSPTVTPSEAAATGVSNPAPNYEQAAGSPATSRITLHANADSWVQVHDGSGNLLFSRILRMGESWQVPAGAGTLYLTTGNAGGTDVLVDGQPTASLGGFGVVRHDLTLDPDQVKAGKLAIPVAAPATTG